MLTRLQTEYTMDKNKLARIDYIIDAFKANIIKCEPQDAAIEKILIDITCGIQERGQYEQKRA